MSTKNKTTDKFSNLDAVQAAMKRAAASLVPTAEELERYAKQDRTCEPAAANAMSRG